jgi:hypothetical protein
MTFDPSDLFLKISEEEKENKIPGFSKRLLLRRLVHQIEPDLCWIKVDLRKKLYDHEFEEVILVLSQFFSIIFLLFEM